MRQKHRLTSGQQRGGEIPLSASVARTKVSLFGHENWHHFSSFSVVSSVLAGSSAGCGWALLLHGAAGLTTGLGAGSAGAPPGYSMAVTHGRQGCCPHALL